MLQQTALKTRVNLELLKRLVAYQQFDIERGEMNTIAELEVYAENTRSLMLYLNLHLLEIDDRDANLAASHLGRCLGICDVIKKSPHMLAINRNQFPTELLLKHELYFDRIWDKQQEGMVREEFYDVLLEVAAYAKKHLELALGYRGKLPKDAHFAFLLAVEA
jgi:NADH dehydrogenase [ubiquinone] 1 alpha subcomplex assembly factor 6